MDSMSAFSHSRATRSCRASIAGYRSFLTSDNWPDAFSILIRDETSFTSRSELVSPAMFRPMI